MKNSTSRIAFPILATLLMAPVTHATILTVDYLGGSLGPTSTIGGNALGADTPFEFVATFDSTGDITSRVGEGVFPALSFSITLLSGPYAGTYTAAPDPSLNVHISDSRYYLPSIGLARGDDQPIWVNWGNMYDPGTHTIETIDADNPYPDAFDFAADSSGVQPFGVPYTIALDGPQGDLVINDMNTDSTNVHATVIPEPAGFGLLAAGSLAAFARRRRKP